MVGPALPTMVHGMGQPKHHGTGAHHGVVLCHGDMHSPRLFASLSLSVSQAFFIILFAQLSHLSSKSA